MSVLSYEGVVKRYGETVALDGCTFSVKAGQMLGLLGPNGAGKTTAMRAVFGLVRPQEGVVTWDGAAITMDERLRFGYMPEERGLYPRMATREQLVYFARLHGMERFMAEAVVDELLEEFGLTDRADHPVSDLSHGNQQRVQLAAALVHDPELLVLDEPFAGLDPIGAATMADMLSRRADDGAAVLFSSHQLDVVEDLCDDVVIIDRGMVVLSGAVMEIRTSSPRRYLDAIVHGAPDWAEGIAGVTVLERTGERTRFELSPDISIAELAATAEASGSVALFSVEPPSLSDVFREAVL